MKTIQRIIIVLLLVAVAAAGYYVYLNKDLLFPSFFKKSSLTPATQVPSEPSFDIAKLLSENPGSDATTEELEAFSAKVFTYSKETNQLNVTSCSPKPIVSLVHLKKPITFINNDAVAHKLVNGSLSINVPAKTVQPITPDFPGPGIYGFSCDSKIVGAFLVMP